MKKTLLIVLFITGVCFAQTYEGMEFYNDGTPKSIKTYKESNDKFELINSISIYGNGQKEEEATFKDGEKDGLVIGWHRNGQKSSEENYKDGKIDDGLVTRWYENGQKKSEGTYKDGRFWNSKCWDEDGNKCECRENWWEGCK